MKSTHYTLESNTLPREFHGFRISVISDFHCKEEGAHEEKLLTHIDQFEPNLVVFTGDMIDGKCSDLNPVIDLLKGLNNRYSMYAIDGNHERDIPDHYEELCKLYLQYGVKGLDDKSDTITRDGATIEIYGKTFHYTDKSEASLGGPMDKNKFNVLLYHDAVAFPMTGSLGYNLILSGHTHGGIIRLPLIGGLINNQGTLFAKYDNGEYRNHGCTMISSRGIGRTSVPRFYNPSELVNITLNWKNTKENEER